MVVPTPDGPAAMYHRREVIALSPATSVAVRAITPMACATSGPAFTVGRSAVTVIVASSYPDPAALVAV